MRSNKKMIVRGAIFIFFLVCLIAFFLFLNKISLVVGNSMGRDKSCNYILLSEPNLERNSLAVFGHDDGQFLKRVVGVPGDTVEVTKTEVIINGKILVSEQPVYLFTEGLYNLGNDEYFMLGDNYQNSEDSKYFGPVKKEQIYSSAVFYKKALNEEDPIVKFLNFIFIEMKYGMKAEEYCRTR